MDYKKVLGSMVDIIIDKPINSYYIKEKNVLYDVNAGFLKTDQNQRCFILGVVVPKTEFYGEVIAIMKPFNESLNEFLIVAPKNQVFYEPYIRNKLSFLKHYNQNKYICKYEKSCGGVVFTYDNDEVMFVLIVNRQNNMGFPKGHIELNETEVDTAKREIFEEIGLNATIIDNFKETNKYMVKGYASKLVVSFLAKIEADDFKMIKIPNNEIKGYEYVDYNKALELLTYDADKAILKNANKFLKRMKERTI